LIQKYLTPLTFRLSPLLLTFPKYRLHQKYRYFRNFRKTPTSQRFRFLPKYLKIPTLQKFHCCQILPTFHWSPTFLCLRKSHYCR
jgi:hypothetical protein